MDINFNFSSFTDEQSYCKLQTQFLLNDHSTWHEMVKKPFRDKTIVYKQFDPLISQEEYIEKEFIKDFLKPGINLLHKKHYKNFIKRINSNHLFTKELRDSLAKLYLNKINSTKDNFEKSTFLPKKLIELLLEQLLFLEDKIESYLKEPYPNIKSKLTFNWNRTDVIYFFHLLRINNVIVEIPDSHLGRIIDSVMEYTNEENKHSEISNSRKHLNDFVKMGGRPETPANERLKTIFTNKDFYNI
jgi:hypothetical protein